MKIAVGLSGGVDSSVALLLLKNEGHDVFGLTMKIWDSSYSFSGGNKHACFGPNEKEEIELAKAVCDSLSVPHVVIDCSKEYKEVVLKYFKEEYLSGKTPNPCVVCNAKMKFGALLDISLRSVSFDKFATGHYANVYLGKITKRYNIVRNGTNKDQSYFLCRLSQEQLSRCIFPLGTYSKEKVRELARANKLLTSETKESQNFYCGDHKELLGIKESIGNILTKDGEKIGEHKGYWNYTVGQKINGLYVESINSDKNEIVASTIDDVVKNTFIVSDLNYISIESIEKFMIHASSEVFFKNGKQHRVLHVKVRSSGALHDCIIEKKNESFEVALLESKTIISPGQFAVFYDDIGRMLFSGIIQ
jgi:tRNA-specific 2-thiouridylase